MKPQVYLAFFKGGKTGLAGLINWVIRAVCKSPYSHCEVCIGNPFEGKARCLSSSGMDGGVRGRLMQLNPERWDLVALWWVLPSDVIQFFEATRAHKYDHFGTLRFLLPLVRQGQKKYFCSEWCGLAVGLQGDAWRFSPAGLFVVARAMSATINYLYGSKHRHQAV